MLHRRFFVLLAALALAACSDGGSGPEPIDPSELRIQKLSGDDQVAQVAAASSSAAGLMASAAAASYELLPEPLVVRLTDAQGTPLATAVLGGGGVLLEPALAGAAATVPAGTVVGFAVLEEGCGSPFVGSAIPDDSAQAEERWVKGTLATECHMEARGIVNGEPVVHTTFTWTALPGPIARWGGAGSLDPLPDSAFPGDSLDLYPSIATYTWLDAHGNVIPQDSLYATFGWAFYGDTDLWGDPTAPTSHERYVVVPGCDDRGIYDYSPPTCGLVGVKIWFGGHDGGGRMLDILDPATRE